jgi:16S rRNA (guanine(1405)-N(7))-methyltransferase
MEAFYARIFAHTGIPDAILDLACGLNPLAFPWMGLPLTTRYHAYDIHAPRVALINHYFSRQGLQPLAAVQDVIVSPPPIEAPVAFFFKEAHRFEQRQRGVNRAFWQALRVRWLVVTLPAASLTGRHDKSDQHRRLVYNTIGDLPWTVVEEQVGQEMIFLIQKGDG